MGCATIFIEDEGQPTLRLHLDASASELSRAFSAADLSELRALAEAYERACRTGSATELAALGRRLSRWLDGREGWLAHLLEVRAPLTLEVRAPIRIRARAELSAPGGLVSAGRAALLAAPWELLWAGGGFLAGDARVEFVPLRRLTRGSIEAGKVEAGQPQPGALTVVFMAAAPLVTELDYEAEEAAILTATEGQALELLVEETGTARELGQRVLRAAKERPVHVVHVTCAGTNPSAPRLLFEDEVGSPVEISGGELCDQLGAWAHELPLLFLSAAVSARGSQRARAHDPIALDLVRRGVPAVLGWASRVADSAATHFARALYGQLSRGETTIERAVAGARFTVLSSAQCWRADWHHARLFLGPRGGGALRQGLARERSESRAFDKIFLDEGRRVPVAGPDQFVGRRRALQTCVRALREPGGLGVLVRGFGHLGKSSLAARVVERLSGSHLPVVLHGAITSEQLIREIARRLGEPASAWERHWSPRAAEGLEEALRDLLDGSSSAASPMPLLLILDDFEQMLEGRLEASHHVAAAHANTVTAILQAFAHAESMSRVVLTSRFKFELEDRSGYDLGQSLFDLPLTSFSQREIDKRTRRVTSEAALYASLHARCGLASRGNPALLDLLLKRALGDPEGCGRLVERLREEHPAAVGEDDADLHEFLLNVAIEDLVDRALRTGERELLALSTGFEVPMPLAILPTLVDACASPETADGERIIALGVWDESRDVVDPTLRAFAANSLVAAWMREAAELPTQRSWRAVLARTLPVLCACWSGLDSRDTGPGEARAGYEATRLGLLADAVEPVKRFGLVGVSWAAQALKIDDAREFSKQTVAALDRHCERPNPMLLRAAAGIHENGLDAEFHGDCLSRAFEHMGEWWGDEHDQARITFDFARMLYRTGEPDRALKLLRTTVLDIFDRLGDVRAQAVTQGQIADILFAGGDYDEALRLYQEGLPVYEQLGDDPAWAVTSGKIATIMFRRGDYDEALRIREREQLPIYERLGDTYSQTVTRGKIAEVLVARGALDEALAVRKAQLPVYVEFGDVRAQAHVWGEIADISFRRGEYEEALRIWTQEDLPVQERLGDVRERANTLGKIADVHEARGDLDEALRIREREQLPVYDRLGDVQARAVVLGKIADIMFRRGDYAEALRIHEREQLPIYERLGEVHLRALTLGKIAKILTMRGEYEEALRICREEQLPVYARLGDIQSCAAVQGRIADILEVRGEYEEALRIRKKEELPTYERTGDVRSLAITWGKIADIHQRRGEYEDALRIRRERELPVYERLGNIRMGAIAWGQIANILVIRGEYDEALRIRREKELPAYRQLGEVRSVAITWGEIADVLVIRGEYEQALQIRRERELSVYERLGDVRAAALAWGQVADILFRMGEYDEALRIHNEEELPVYERLDDARERAITLGKIADILFRRGEFDEALRIHQAEGLPVYERLGDVRAWALTGRKVVDILFARGAFDEALRMLEEELVPTFEGLGDVRSRALCRGQVADIQVQRGKLEEALRIHEEELLPVYEQLGDVHSRAISWGKIAGIHATRGDLELALRVRLAQELPVYEQLGDRQSQIVTRVQIAILLANRGREEDQAMVVRLFVETLREARRLRLKEADEIAGILRGSGLDPDAAPFADP